MTLLSLLFFSVSLSGCAGFLHQPKEILIKVQQVAPQLPDGDFVCEEKPAVSTARPTQAYVAGLLAEYEFAVDDCRSKLAKVKEKLDLLRKSIDESNAKTNTAQEIEDTDNVMFARLY